MKSQQCLLAVNWLYFFFTLALYSIIQCLFLIITIYSRRDFFSICRLKQRLFTGLPRPPVSPSLRGGDGPRRPRPLGRAPGAERDPDGVRRPIHGQGPHAHAGREERLGGHQGAQVWVAEIKNKNIFCSFFWKSISYFFKKNDVYCFIQSWSRYFVFNVCNAVHISARSSYTECNDFFPFSSRLNNLKPTTKYTFEVYALTEVGRGRAAVAAIQSGVEPVLPSPPTR